MYQLKPYDLNAIQIPKELPKTWPEWFEKGLKKIMFGIIIKDSKVYVELNYNNPTRANPTDFIIQVGADFIVLPERIFKNLTIEHG